MTSGKAKFRIVGRTAAELFELLTIGKEMHKRMMKDLKQKLNDLHHAAADFHQTQEECNFISIAINAIAGQLNEERQGEGKRYERN